MSLTINEIATILEEKQGYKKWGIAKLSSHLKVSETKIVQAKKLLKSKTHKTVKPSLKKGINKVTVNTQGLHVIIPDAHVPFHNKKLFKAFILFLKDLKPQGLHIIGDFLDMYSMSSHDRGKVGLKGMTLGFEYKEGNRLLDEIDKVLPKSCVKTYIYGNHEDRYFRYMKELDHSKIGDTIPDPTTALKLKERNYVVCEDWKDATVTLGSHLDLVHGEFIATHTAKKHIDTYRRSTVFGHTHRVQSHIEGQTAGYNIGAMADFDSKAFNYATKSMKLSWNNGFAVVYIDKDKFFNLQQVMWYNNKFIFGDKIYK